MSSRFDKIYTLYIPKNKNDTEVLVSSVVNQYLNSIKYNNFMIVSSPGYLSRTENTIKLFTEDLLKGISKEISIAIFNGMNGNIKLVGEDNKRVSL